MITPDNEAALSEAVASATGPLCLLGGGTGAVVETGEPLTTTALSGITLYEPGALTMVAQAGTPLSEIETALAAEKQRLAWEPWDARGLMGRDGAPTIGGVVATNASGPRRIAVGACRDHLLGVRFVDGTGTVIKNGGRVMKNVTGYDLVKLMAGSHGTLGVLSEVSFKVLPAPAAVAVVLIEGLDDSAAVQAMSAALGSPFEVTGAAHLPVGMDGDPVTMIRIEGFEASVLYRAGKLRDLLARFGEATIETDPDTTTAGWRYVRDVEPFHGTDGDVWRISVKPGDGPGVAAGMDAIKVIYDWGGGLIWALVAPGTDVRGAMGDVRGHATRIRGTGNVARFHPEPAPLAALSKGLRQKFDPRGILNQGLMDG